MNVCAKLNYRVTLTNHFQGEEIGMLNANISYEDTIDPQGCNCGPDRYQCKNNSDLFDRQ